MKEKFLKSLLAFNKKECILFSVNALKDKQIDIITLYEDVFTPALKEVGRLVYTKELSIWDEHITSSIIRSCIENCFLFLEAQHHTSSSSLVLCPDNEEHDIGALMVSNYLTILGFESYYLGANTPQEDIQLAIKTLQPSVIAISISNYYNLTALKEIVDIIKSINPATKIIIGGYAVNVNKDVLEKNKDIIIANNFKELKENVGDLFC